MAARVRVDAETGEVLKVLASEQAATHRAQEAANHGLHNVLAPALARFRQLASPAVRFKKMTCRCGNLPDALYYEDAPKAFFAELEETAASEWVKLFRCKRCGQHWSIDEWDKYQERVITKIFDPKNWQAHESTDLRKGLLLQSRGGTTDQKCIWAACDGKQVKGVVLCIDHLYATGARK